MSGLSLFLVRYNEGHSVPWLLCSSTFYYILSFLISVYGYILNVIIFITYCGISSYNATEIHTHIAKNARYCWWYQHTYMHSAILSPAFVSQFWFFIFDSRTKNIIWLARADMFRCLAIALVQILCSCLWSRAQYIFTERDISTA